MKFLDLNGLKHIWAKIKESFDTAVVNNSDYKTDHDDAGHINIPFVANHQIVAIDIPYGINVYNWFQKASKGGILEVFLAGAQESKIFCYSNSNYMYKMQTTSHGPFLYTIESLATAYDTYARLIKTDDNKLVVAEFVQNK